MTGCGEDDPEPGPEVASGNAGVDEAVDEDVEILDVQLDHPLDEQPGTLVSRIRRTPDRGEALVDGIIACGHGVRFYCWHTATVGFGEEWHGARTRPIGAAGRSRVGARRVVVTGAGADLQSCTVVKALTVEPGTAGSAEISDVPDPRPRENLLVEGIAVGICGTDREIVAGEYGWAPPGQDRLVLGHESLGRVHTAPAGSDFSRGDLVVGVVRRPDPVPCGACAHGEFDMCRNGRYTERGIKEIDGFASELWSLEPGYAVRLDAALETVGMLMEPTSVVAKVWEQVERIGHRSWFSPARVLVTGAGPIGLLAALLGQQRGLEVHVLDQVRSGRKPDLVAGLGATYHSDGFDEAVAAGRPDIVIEATGAAHLVLDAMAQTAAYGITCLTGVSATGRRVELDAGGLNRSIVLQNDVVVGSVNANLRHYRLAAEALAGADRDWLAGLITRRVPLDDFAGALRRDEDDVKVVLTLGD